MVASEAWPHTLPVPLAAAALRAAAAAAADTAAVALLRLMFEPSRALLPLSPPFSRPISGLSAFAEEEAAGVSCCFCPTRVD